MPFCCPVVSLYIAVTRAILAYDCNETYCSILELFVHCNITIFTVSSRLGIDYCRFALQKGEKNTQRQKLLWTTVNIVILQ